MISSKTLERAGGLPLFGNYLTEIARAAKQLTEQGCGPRQGTASRKKCRAPASQLVKLKLIAVLGILPSTLICFELPVSFAHESRFSGGWFFTIKVHHKFDE